jgi:hypothetical protein
MILEPNTRNSVGFVAIDAESILRYLGLMTMTDQPKPNDWEIRVFDSSEPGEPDENDCYVTLSEKDRSQSAPQEEECLRRRRGRGRSKKASASQ